MFLLVSGRHVGAHLEEAFISMCRSSGVIFFHFNSKTQRQMFLLRHGRHVCVPSKDRNLATLNLGNTLLRIARE